MEKDREGYEEFDYTRIKIFYNGDLQTLEGEVNKWIENGEMAYEDDPDVRDIIVMSIILNSTYRGNGEYRGKQTPILFTILIHYKLD